MLPEKLARNGSKHVSATCRCTTAADLHAEGLAQGGAFQLLPFDAQGGEGGVPTVALEVGNEVLDDGRRNDVADILCVLALRTLPQMIARHQIAHGCPHAWV